MTCVCVLLVLTVSFHSISFTSSECLTCLWARLEMCVGSSSWYLQAGHEEANELRHLGSRTNQENRNSKVICVEVVGFALCESAEHQRQQSKHTHTLTQPRCVVNMNSTQ